MLIAIGIIGILTIISMIIMFISLEDVWVDITLTMLALVIILLITGCFTGFVNHPATEGVHQGIITAVDLEGVYFRRYEVYLKSSGYTSQSDESIYLIYEYERELAEQLKNTIGKEVKLIYGHDGGYIPWNSCGTYHIKSFEIMEEKQMDCETNDCRVEKRGCDGCFYQEKHSYILNLTSREEILKCNLELLEQLEETIKENNEKDISIRMLKNELEKYKKENKDE